MFLASTQHRYAWRPAVGWAPRAHAGMAVDCSGTVGRGCPPYGNFMFLISNPPRYARRPAVGWAPRAHAGVAVDSSGTVGRGLPTLRDCKDEA